MLSRIIEKSVSQSVLSLQTLLAACSLYCVVLYSCYRCSQAMSDTQGYEKAKPKRCAVQLHSQTALALCHLRRCTL